MKNRFLRRKAVEDVTGLSRAHIYRLMAENEFPRPYKLSARAVAWKFSEIEEWLNSRERSA